MTGFWSLSNLRTTLKIRGNSRHIYSCCTWTSPPFATAERWGSELLDTRVRAILQMFQPKMIERKAM